MIQWELMLMDGYKDDKEMLQDLYLNKGMSIKTISEKLGISRHTTFKRLVLHGIPRRPPFAMGPGRVRLMRGSGKAGHGKGL